MPRLETVFPALALVFGLAYAALTPPLQAPDEVRHLLRVFAVARGELFASSGAGEVAHVQVPRGALALERELQARELRRHPERRADLGALRHALAAPLDPELRPVRLPSLYSPLPYAPQALAVALARAAGGSAVLCLYAGRLGNLLTYVLLVALALRRAPAHRRVLALLAVLPMAVFEGASVTADAATNGLAFWFVAELLRACAGSGPLRARELGLLCGLAAGVGLCKQAYAPLALAAALLPAARFSGAAARWAAVAAVAAAGALPAGLWFLALGTLKLGPLTVRADPQAQLAFVRTHPLETLRIFAVTAWKHAARYQRTFIGHLGHLDVPLPQAVYYLWPPVLGAAALLDGRGSPVRGAGRALWLGVAALCWGVTLLLAYVGWNEPGDTLVRHVQGRYFLPFAPAALAAVHLSRQPTLRWPRWGDAALGGLAALPLLAGAVALLQRYWLP